MAERSEDTALTGIHNDRAPYLTVADGPGRPVDARVSGPLGEQAYLRDYRWTRALPFQMDQTWSSSAGWA